MPGSQVIKSRVRGELITFRAPDGTLLNGFLRSPRQAELCVVHVHGMSGNFYSGRSSVIGDALLAHRIAFFAINTRGHDPVARVRNTSGETATIGTNYEKFEDCVLDITGALNALTRLGFKRFMLSGYSTGCQKIAYYQARRRDRRVRGLIFIAPSDDHSSLKRDLGGRFTSVVRLARRMKRSGAGGLTHPSIPFGMSARRFLSVADPKSVEAQVFNYSGRLRTFSAAARDTPVGVIFGGEEQYLTVPVPLALQLLGRAARSVFTSDTIPGADHSFFKRDQELGSTVAKQVRYLASFL